ncbi:hypothetical protein DM860_007532 [Cuscuta australis]|uniref:NAC domain-containing protein n=1 Tax=Cuscuta australis TaxID=267555 RepID=A0A328E464_9ASTE|nr:hypothetical protein DM860_007532 [Cuscuta australis]
MEVAAYQNPNLPVAVSEAQPPVGYRFRPTDSELLDHYLRRLIHRLPLPTLYPRITRLDIYADHPSAIWNLGDAHDDTGSGPSCTVTSTPHCKALAMAAVGKRWEERSGHMGLGTCPALGKPRRMRKKKLKGAVDESVMLSNQQQQGFGEIVLSSNHGDPAKQPNLELSPESITCSFDKVSDHDEVGSSSPTTFTSVPLSHQQPLLENTHQAHTAALLEPLSQFENSDFNDVLCETQGGHPQQPRMDHSHGSIVTTSSDSFELEDFDDIFLDLGDSVALDDVREEAYYQPTVGSIGSQQNTTCKRARVEEGTRCVEYDQHTHDAGANGAKRYKKC